MKIQIGNIWDARETHSYLDWVCIPTNGITNNDQLAIMGKGVARQAAQRFPTLREDLGEWLWTIGNHVGIFASYKLFTFPTKHHWADPAVLPLIERSAKELRTLIHMYEIYNPVYMVMPGCGNGGLTWDTVRPVIEPYLKELVTIVDID
jgi:hypothetical protein